MALIKIRNPVLQIASLVVVGLVTMVVIDLLISDDSFVSAAVQAVLTALISLGILYFVFIRRRDSSRD